MSGSDESGPSWERVDFAGTSEEHRRLVMLERAYDPFTIAHLERTGVAAGWRFLEVGAGAGSIAAWLATRAGASCVTATELFPQYLEPVAELGVRVLRHDIAKDPPVGADFDLIHARLVLEHVRAREEVLQRLATWLVPGGWLVVEDATFVPEIAVRPALRRLEEAWMASGPAMTGSDLTWARTFPLPLERAGLTGTSAEVSTPIVRGGSPVAGNLAAAARLSAALVEHGALTADQLEEVQAALADPAYVDCSFLIVAAWGRRPQTT